MALPRDVFKAKMEEGRRLAAEKRAAQLQTGQKAMMTKAVEERMAQIKAQEQAYGGYSELGKDITDGDTALPESEMPSKPDVPGTGNGITHYDSVPNLPRSRRTGPSELAQESSPAASPGTTAILCQLCRDFPWTNVPINIARDRFRWLIDEVQRVSHLMTSRENEFSRKRGCSICNGHPVIPDHWYHVKNTIDRSSGVEYTLYACSQPCFIQLPVKFPHLYGVVRGDTGRNPLA